MPTATAPAEDWRSWPVEERAALHARLAERLRTEWRRQAKPAQVPPDRWTTLFLRGGRGSGKSWAGAHILGEMIREAPEPSEWAVVAPTYRDARDTCIEGEAGLLAALGTSRGEIEGGRSASVAVWNRSQGEVRLHDGHVVFLDGADDGAYRIQGKNLAGAWADEIGLWKRWREAWDESLRFALRKGDARLVATGTPKRNLPARALVRRLLSDPLVVSRQLRTRDNLENLSPAMLALIEETEGTALGRQELEGELLEDIEGALWRTAWIHKVDELPHPAGEWQGMPVVGVDPSDGNEDGAENAYTVVGLALDHRLYVVESRGFRSETSVYDFACEAIDAARRWGAQLILERNHGGQWLEDTFNRAMRERRVVVPMTTVHASQGKRTRAEPVAALYETGRVSHLGEFAELEGQLTSFTGAPGEASPDRLDSLVWAMSKFTPRSFGPPVSGGVHRYTDQRVAGVHPWR